jgi:hypothetical protein
MKSIFGLSVMVFGTFLMSLTPLQDSKSGDARSSDKVGTQKAEQVVRDWLERWNALDGSDKATARVLELYQTDATHQTSPSEKQMGAVVYEGQDQIRKMIQDFAAANTEIAFHFQAATAKEKSSDMLHFADGPWGGVSVAFQYIGAYTMKKDKTRWMCPGAAFFQIQDGKIRSVRLYMARDETMRVYNR